MARLAYPAAPVDVSPSPSWYFGRAVYVSRRDYAHIFRAFVLTGAVAGLVTLPFGPAASMRAILTIAAVGLALLAYSLMGLWRMYGTPSRLYLRQLLAMAKLPAQAVVADVHIGTFRTTFALAELLPDATITSIDAWPGFSGAHPAELAVADVRSLEPAPTSHPRIRAVPTQTARLPLSDASVDAVVLGFGTHEIPLDLRATLFSEVVRVLRPGGHALMFEHGQDLKNYFIFGPVIYHVTSRDEWAATFRKYFANVAVGRNPIAVDLFVGVQGG